jgi:tetratricopeptide (TPR) repeat protein
VLRSPSTDGQELRAALEEASRHLGPHDARFFRLLSASPGPDISLTAAAILATADQDVTLARLDELAGLAASRNHQRLFRRMSDLYRSDAEVARGALRVLTQMRLVERPADPERWRLPTAVRPYAAQQGCKHAEQDQRGPVRMLLHLYYLAGAHDASASLDSGIIAPALRGQATGLRWLAAEYPNLVATVHEAGNDNDDLSAVITLDLTRSLAHITHLERRFDDAVALGPIARRAAQRLHDRHAEAVVLRNLGIDLICTGRQDEAITTLHQALSIYQELGDLIGEGTTLTNLGSAFTQAGQFAEADTVLRNAIDIHRRQGRRFSEAVALTSLATLLDMTGQPEAAITALMDADRIYRKIGDQHRRSGVLVHLADALRRAGHHEEAIKVCRRAAMLARVSGDLPLAAAALQDS